MWNHHHAVPLSDFVIADIKRIAERETVGTMQWQAYPAPVQAIVETPVYRKELGLWLHQKFFVQRAFADHQQGGARYVLADQVGLGYRDSVEDRVHELLSERLEDIFELFGQVPDILEEAWVDIALGEEQEAKRKIRSIPKRHPFDERYSQVDNMDWDSCSKVLDAVDRRKMLMEGC